MKKIYSTVIIVAAIAGLAGCITTPTQQGAALGGALGAGLGAIIGNQSGHAGTGALIGAGAGGVTGALLGEQVGRNQQRAYAPAPPPPPAPVYQPQPQRGHYETRLITAPNGETYEERVWVPDR